MKTKIILSALIGATSSLFALGGEFAYLYKDPRIMGMGGANVAVGGYSTSVFSNPAGLASIKKDDGFVVDLLSVGVSASSGFIDFANDISSADQNTMTDTLAKYNGQNLSVNLNNYSAVSKNSELFAWSIGLLSAADVSFQSHTSGSPSAGILGAAGRAYGGLVLGAAKEYQTTAGRIDVGVGFKYITQRSYEGSLNATELLNSDNITSTLQDKYEKNASGFGLDLGVNYSPFQDNFLHPKVGLSILNIGSMNMDNNYGKQPLTVNLGASISPEVPVIDHLVVALDYVDMFNANEVRFYNIDGSYDDLTDSDMLKRIRLGIGVGLIDTSLFSTQVNLGLYQGAYTAGLDMRQTAMTLNLVTYEEELGTGSASKSDRRYMAQIGIGW